MAKVKYMGMSGNNIRKLKTTRNITITEELSQLKYLE
jgi:hypothetical protein